MFDGMLINMNIYIYTCICMFDPLIYVDVFEYINKMHVHVHLGIHIYAWVCTHIFKNVHGCVHVK